MRIIKVTENKFKKNCGDCLHCKVACISTKDNKLCFCSQAKKKIYFTLAYWITKKVCKNFEDMTA